MHVRDLKKRIPPDVRARAQKGHFSEPDWYAGPLLDDPFEPEPVDRLDEGDDWAEEERKLKEQHESLGARGDKLGALVRVQRLVRHFRRRPSSVA